MNMKTEQANFIVLHGKTGKDNSLDQMYEAMKEIFKIKKFNISEYGNARGKIVKFSERSFLKYLKGNVSDSIELHGGTNIYGYEGVPVHNWGLLTAYFPTDNIFIIGEALDSKKTENELYEIISHCKLLDLFDYGYGYSSSIPYGLGYAIGICVEDNYHDMLNFEDDERISNWRRAVSWRTDFKYLRDIFCLNIFSKEKLAATNIKSIIQKDVLFQPLDGYFLWKVADDEISFLRTKLKNENLLVSEHASNTFSQIYPL